MKRILALLAFSASGLFAQTPVVTQILNNYSLINAGSVARGAIFIVKGSALSDQQTGLQSVTLQTTLVGVRMEITVNGTTTFAPMYYALPTQLAGILPSNTPEGFGTLTVRNNGKSSAPASINVVRSAFGMLTVSGDGSGAARLQDASQGYQELSLTRATNPGNFLVFYGSGVGPTTGNETVEQLGANASGNLESIPITVTIGGKPATVFYRGRTAFPGLDQINVQVPTLDASSYGCSVAVVIITNNVQANSTTIPVAASGSTCPPPPNNGGGGNTSTVPTQSEIDSWIANGYSYGGINLGRSTSYVVSENFTGVGPSIITTTTKASVFDAFFGRISGLGSVISNQIQDYVSPRVGQCTVLTLNTSNFSPFPNLTFTSYDAGPAITANGPNGTQVATRESFGGFFSYDAPNLPITYITAGRYSLSGTGGPNVGAFSGSLTIGADLNWTNWEEAKVINRSNSFTVRWTGGDSSQQVFISGSQVSSTFQIVTFSCLANRSAGQFTIPSSILSQLSASPSIGAGGFSIITRGDLSISNANNGTRLNASGLDYFTASDSSETSVTSEYR